MPLPWPAPTLPPIPVGELSQTQTPISEFGDEIQVTGKVQDIDPIHKIVRYSEGVAAKYGPTVVFADRLEIHHADGDKYVLARGNVRVEDPEGELTAESFTLWYGPQRGPDGQLAVADHVTLNVAGVEAQAESVTIRPQRWELLNVEATNCKRPVPLYLLKAKRVVIEPGKEGTIYKPRLSILGKEIGTLPTRHFSLDRRSPGLQMPTPAFKSGAGFGINWASGFLIDDQSIVKADFSSFPRDYPSYSVSYAHSFLPANKSNAKIAARSELVERFNWSYFDNVRVESLATTQSFTMKPRSSITAQSVWNTGSSARLKNEDFSKAIDVAFEQSGPVGPFGLNFQVRGQSIRRTGEDFIERAVLSATLQAPSLKIADKLQTDVRADLFGIGGAGSFGWVRGQAGIMYQPIPQLALGAAWISAAESGTPDFISDRLVSKNAFHARADLNLGPTQISFLAKYDSGRKRWYDREYSISQVVGCLEPFIVRREFPNDYALGVRFRLNDFFGLLERRKIERTKPVGPQVISSLSGGK
jgi:hypothetical protein